MLHFILFVISFMVGLFFIYLSPIEYKTVVVYPSLTNLDKIQYKDKTDHCFQFNAKLVNCDNTSKRIPVQ
jgi:hypothetical protein